MTGVPKSSERLVDQAGRPTFAWYRVLSRIAQLVTLDDVRAFFRALLTRLGSPDGTLENLPPIATGSYLPTSTQVSADYSIDATGTLAGGVVSLTLVNDEFEPLPTHYYGTGADGGRGYQAVADAFTASPEITLTVQPDGVTLVGLTPVPASVAGTLVAITYNGFGQVTGSRPATITGTAGRITVANGDAAAGLPTLDLALVTATAGGVFRVFDVDSWGRVTARTTRTITGTAGQVAVANGTGAAGEPTISLAAVANGGGGTLQKTVFDGFGRATGYSAASTDDLAEGATNQWFSVERAQDAVGAAIAAGTGDGAALTYNDPGNAINVTNTDKGSTAVTAHVAAADPHTQYMTHAKAMSRVSLRF